MLKGPLPMASLNGTLGWVLLENCSISEIIFIFHETAFLLVYFLLHLWFMIFFIQGFNLYFILNTSNFTLSGK